MTEPTSGSQLSPENRVVMVVLAYLWLLAVVPLLVERTDAEVQWHAKHGLVLTAAELVVLMAWSLFVSLASVVAGPLGCLFYVLSIPLIFLPILALHVLAIVKAIGGRRLVIPYLSDFASRF